LYAFVDAFIVVDVVVSVDVVGGDDVDVDVDGKRGTNFRIKFVSDRI